MRINLPYFPLSSSGYDYLPLYLPFRNYWKRIFCGNFHYNLPHLDHTPPNTPLTSGYIISLYIKLQFFILNWHNYSYIDSSNLDEYLEEVLVNSGRFLKSTIILVNSFILYW